MSTKQIFRVGLLATAGAATMAMAANAQSSRYGNVYDYESAPNCGQACVAPAPVAAGRYSAPVQAAPVYVDCQAMGTCAPAPTYQAPVYSQPTTVYTAPTYQAPTYSAPTYQAPTYAQAPANCPAGTTAQADGTCMQSGSSYSSTTTYDTYSAPAMNMGQMADCPAGTTAQADGTCMQSGTSSYSSGSTYSGTTSYDSYSSGSSYGSMSGAMADCPAGTTAQADGTCMQGGSSYVGTSVDIYSGDAGSTATQGYGYQSDGSYGSTDYLPIRK